MSEPIDGVTRSGIPYRRGGGPSIFGGLTVAWDVLPDCPECAKPTGEKCFMVIGDKECTKITPHKERLPEVNVVGDALEPDEEAATADASAPTPPGEGPGTGTGGPDAPGASEAAEWDRLTEMNLNDLPKWEADLLDRQAATQAAIEAAARAMREDNQARRASPDFDPPTFDELPDEVQEHHRLLARAAVRAAEPIFTERVLAILARHINESEDAAGCETCCSSRIKDAAAEIAREVGRG